MKKYIIILVIIIGLIACNKNDTGVSPLEAKWRIENISGGLHGGGYEANFRYLEFIDEKNCNWLDSMDNILDSGIYDLSTEDSKDYITFESDTDSLSYSFTHFKKQYRFISSDTLYMADGCCDLYDYLFIKEN